MNKSTLIARMAVVVHCALISALYGCSAQPDTVGINQVTQDGCLRCHGADRGISAAPPFASISQRYTGNDAAAAALVASLKNGTHGKWTEYPGAGMPPQAQLSEAEAKALAQWVLKQ